MISPYKAASLFTIHAHKAGTFLTHMQLQKLIYIAHGYSLALLNEPLVDCEVGAWKFGPVFPSLYHQLKCYEGIPVPCFNDQEHVCSHLSAIIKSVYENYGHLRGVKLSQLTNHEDTPWHKLWVEREVKPTIPDQDIKEYYAKICLQ